MAYFLLFFLGAWLRKKEKSHLKILKVHFSCAAIERSKCSESTRSRGFYSQSLASRVLYLGIPGEVKSRLYFYVCIEFGIIFITMPGTSRQSIHNIWNQTRDHQSLNYICLRLDKEKCDYVFQNLLYQGAPVI